MTAVDHPTGPVIAARAVSARWEDERRNFQHHPGTEEP